MTTLEIKTRIHKAVDNVPDSALPQVLQYLESVQESSTEYDKMDQIIDKIIEQEDALLRRLAE
jgi:hypothetical protein